MRPLLALVILMLASGCDGPAENTGEVLLPDGGRYRGERVDGHLQGQGRIDYPNGSYYSGTFDAGLSSGHGEWHGANGEHYRGQFRLGQFDGKGTLTYRNGTFYTGQFQLGRMQGHGRLVQEGLEYRGEFAGDRFQGQGVLTWADGSRHEGLFQDGQAEGAGVRTDADGGQLSGTFHAGELQGAGRYQDGQGNRYTGDFQDDRFAGNGVYVNADGDRWSGHFANDALDGEGQYQGADGTHYQGRFRDWRYHGDGVLTEADGRLYRGRFVDGRFDGPGTLTRADGTVEAGVWQGGRRIRDAAGRRLPDPLETGLLTQGRLLEDMLQAVPSSTAASDLYSLVLAGDGTQGVFMREADYVNTLMHDRFAALGQISLVNHREHLADRPMATRESLARAITILAERSAPDDLIFIYLTSHGSADHTLSLDQPGLALTDLGAAELAELLAPLRERDKVVVISACYAGGFIPPLQDERTLLMTAARADRVSFGCSDDNEFTYFGRALFADTLTRETDLRLAFQQARALIEAREREDGFEHSEPQLWAPEPVLRRWHDRLSPRAGAAPATGTAVRP